MKFSETEYVYNWNEPFEFRKVKVETHIENDTVMLKLFPDYMITEDELEGMLKGFQADVLDKRHIKLASECNVVITHEGKNYNVEISGNPLAVKRIIPA